MGMMGQFFVCPRKKDVCAWHTEFIGLRRPVFVLIRADVGRNRVRCCGPVAAAPQPATSTRITDFRVAVPVRC